VDDPYFWTWSLIVMSNRAQPRSTIVLTDIFEKEPNMCLQQVVVQNSPTDKSLALGLTIIR